MGMPADSKGHAGQVVCLMAMRGIDDALSETISHPTRILKNEDALPTHNHLTVKARVDDAVIIRITDAPYIAGQDFAVFFIKLKQSALNLAGPGGGMKVIMVES
jgi:hypothetical protein